MRGGTIAGSRRRRPSRPVRLRLPRMPRVGPPAATRSSTAHLLRPPRERWAASFPDSPRRPSPDLVLDPPRPEDDDRREPSPSPVASGAASSRWDDAVCAAGDPSTPSSASSAVRADVPAPPDDLPRPRPPRRRRLRGAPDGVSDGVSDTVRACLDGLDGRRGVGVGSLRARSLRRWTCRRSPADASTAPPSATPRRRLGAPRRGVGRRRRDRRPSGSAARPAPRPVGRGRLLRFRLRRRCGLRACRLRPPSSSASSLARGLLGSGAPRLNAAIRSSTSASGRRRRRLHLGLVVHGHSSRSLRAGAPSAGRDAAAGHARQRASPRCDEVGARAAAGAARRASREIAHPCRPCPAPAFRAPGLVAGRRSRASSTCLRTPPRATDRAGDGNVCAEHSSAWEPNLGGEAVTAFDRASGRRPSPSGPVRGVLCVPRAEPGVGWIPAWAVRADTSRMSDALPRQRGDPSFRAAPRPGAARRRQRRLPGVARDAARHRGDDRRRPGARRGPGARDGRGPRPRRRADGRADARDGRHRGHTRAEGAVPLARRRGPDGLRGPARRARHARRRRVGLRAEGQRRRRDRARGARGRAPAAACSRPRSPRPSSTS